MASAFYNFAFLGSYNDTTNTFTTWNGSTSGGTGFFRAMTDGNDADNTFSIDETLNPNPDDSSVFFDAKFVGSTNEGILVEDQFGTYYLLTNSTTLSSASLSITESDLTFCFARCTLIATPEGDRPVEALQIGDCVLTAEGKAVPVKWIGRQTINPLFARFSEQLPVRIRAGALGDGLPTRDLYVSPDHAMLVDGVLVHALALVNGLSITQMEDWPHENVEYFHIELENHELVLAEGAPAETFVDNGSRTRFDNYAEYLALYGEESAIPELDFPRVKYQRQLSAFTKKRLLAIAQEAEATAA